VWGLIGGGSRLWFGMANHLTHASDNWVRLASGLLQLHKASVEMVKISDNHLPCCQTIVESNLSENILQNQIGETSNV